MRTNHPLIMIEHSSLQRRQRRRRALPIACDHVEGHLHVKNILGQLLERKQVHGLLVQLVHPFLPVFRRGLKYSCDGALDGDCLLHAQQQQRKHHSGRMRNYSGTRLQLRNQRFSQLPLDPRGTHHSVRFIFQSGSKIDNRTARSTSCLPIFTRRLWRRSEKCEVHFLELFAADILNECYLVTHRFQLPQRFLVVQQPHVERREIAIVEHIRNFLTLECACTHNREAVRIASAHSFEMRCRNRLEIRTHEVCDASLYDGGGDLRLRRKIHCRRQNTPENT